MSTKIQKSILATGAVTLGSVLTQTAHADQLDDAVKDAQKVGFEATVTTKTVTVSTKSEADKLNQEEATRIQKLANDVRSTAKKVEHAQIDELNCDNVIGWDVDSKPQII